MSEETNDFAIRAGAFHGPAAILAGDPRRFERTLRSLGLPTDAEQIIGADEYLKGISDVIRSAEDNDFFLHVSLEQDVGELGVFGRAIVSSDTLWEALQTATTALRYFQNNSELVIRTYRGKCRIWYFTLLNSHDGKQDIQYTIGLLTKVVLMALGEVDPQITVAYPGASSEHFQNNSAVESVRDSNQGYIEFHEDLLRAKMHRSDSVRADILSRYLRGKKLMQAPQVNRADLVAGLIKASFGIAPWSLSDTAQVLGVGPRTLQIQLKDEGTAFRDIQKIERHKEACRLLTSGASIDDTANAIGFEHRQSFSEAFVGWEGCAPSTYAKSKVLT